MSARWPYPRILAHRGGGTLAPENTLAAIRLGASLGFQGVEFDVMLAGDGTPVLVHDERLERTTNGKGSVARTPYAEIARLDAGSWCGERWRGERVPRFSEAAQLCRESGLWANVEIKPATGFEAQTGRRTAQLALELWRGSLITPLVSSFSNESLVAAREAAPALPRGLIVKRIPQDWKTRMQELDCVALHCDHRELRPELVTAVHTAGYAVVCWTVNQPTEACTLFGWNVDCIITDRLDLIGPDFR